MRRPPRRWCGPRSASVMRDTDSCLGPLDHATRPDGTATGTKVPRSPGDRHGDGQAAGGAAGEVAGEAAGEAAGRAGSRRGGRLWPRRTLLWTWRVGGVLFAAWLVERFVLPQLAGARESWEATRSGTLWWLVVAFGLEAVSLLCYSGLTLAVLRTSGAPPYRTIFRIDLTGYGLSHVIPGGGASSAAVRFRLYWRAGVSTQDAVTATAVTTAVTTCTLVAEFIVGLLVTLREPGHHPYLVTAAWVAGGALAFVVLVLVVLLVFPDTTIRTAVRVARHVPVMRPEGVESLGRGMVARLHRLAVDRRAVVQAVSWSLGYYATDTVCLYVCLRAFDYSADVPGLVAAYGLVNLLALLPLTPGGLGIVEGVLVPVLVSFGTPQGVALLGVLAWRFFAFWMPIPAAFLAYLSLRAGPLRHHDLPRSPRALGHPVGRH